MFKTYWNGLYSAKRSFAIYCLANFVFYILFPLSLAVTQPPIAIIFIGISFFLFTVPFNIYLTCGIWRSLHYDYYINATFEHIIQVSVVVFSGITFFIGFGLVYYHFFG